MFLFFTFFSTASHGFTNQYQYHQKKHNFDPLNPAFIYIVKLEFTGVYIICISDQKHTNVDCGYSLEPPRRGGSNEYPQFNFFNRNIKKNYQNFYRKTQFFMMKFSIYLNRCVCVLHARAERLLTCTKCPPNETNADGVLDYISQNEKKTYILTCKLNQDSNQPAYPHCLIKVFVVRMKKFCNAWLSKMRPVKILIRLRECAG